MTVIGLSSTKRSKIASSIPNSLPPGHRGEYHICRPLQHPGCMFCDLKSAGASALTHLIESIRGRQDEV
jgi:hypothetical protein